MATSRKLLIASVAALLLVVGVVAGVFFSGAQDSGGGNATLIGESPYLSATAEEQLAPEEGTTGNVTVTEASVIVGDLEAPRVSIYDDFLCPFCRALDLETSEQVEEWIANGDIAVEYVVVDYLGVRSTNNYSTRAANLAAFVADSSPENWFAVKTALYEAQPAARGEEGPSDDDLIALARDNGVEISAEDEANIKGLAYLGWVNNATAKAAEAGVGGIPTVLIDGVVVEEAGDPEGFLDAVAAVVE